MVTTGDDGPPCVRGWVVHGRVTEKGSEVDWSDPEKKEQLTS